jgi:hypothetical protein
MMKAADALEPLLRRLAKKPPLEVRLRIEKVLLTLKPGTFPNPRVRALRAIDLLERIGTPEARQLLQALAEGAPGAGQTRAAKEACQRLANR